MNSFFGVLLTLSGLLPFSLPNMTTQTQYNSEDHKGGVFVVEAFFYGCHYCHANSNNVHELAEQYRGNDKVQVMDVGIDRRDDYYAAWVRQHGCTHPVLKDDRKELIGKLGTHSYPSTYVVNCRGELVAETSGVWDSGIKRRLRSAVDKAVGECK